MRQVPQKDAKLCAFSLPKTLMATFKENAAGHNKYQNELLVDLITEYLEQEADAK